MRKDTPINVFYVEDNKQLRDLLATVLPQECTEIRVETLPTPRDALENLTSTAPDCIVSDYEMPGMDGIEFLRNVRESYPDLPFILYTGKGSETVASEAISAGVTDYLQKESSPEHYELLATRIETAVDKHRTETELTRKNDLFSEVQELASIGAWEWNPQTQTGYYSDGVRDIYEIDHQPDPSPDKDIDEFYHPDDRETIRDAFTEAVETGRTYDIEVRLDVDDTTKWVRTRGEPEFKNGECVRVRGTIQDITAQRIREQKLSQVARQIQELVTATTTKESAQIATSAAADIIDGSLSGVHLANPAENTMEPVATADPVDNVFEHPPTYRRDAPDGSRSSIIWSVYETDTPIYIDNTRESERVTEATPAQSALIYPITGHGVFVVSDQQPNAFDTVDKQLAEIISASLAEALNRIETQQQQQQRAARVEELHDIQLALNQAKSIEQVADIVVTRAHGVLGFPLAILRRYDEDVGGLVPVAMNESAKQVFNDRPVFRPGDGSFNWEVYETGQRTVVDDVSEFSRAVDQETSLENLMIFPLGDFGTLSVGATDTAMFDETDIRLGQLLAETAEATIAQLQHQQQVQQQRDQLQDKATRLEKFTTTMSHDLRNRLQAVSGRIQLAQQTDDSEHLPAAADAADRAEKLLDDLVTIAHSEQQQYNAETISVEAVAAEAWETVSTSEASLVIETDSYIHADRRQLHQLFENVFDNAVKHNNEKVIVRVGETHNGLFIEDDGTGLPMDDQERIFDAGYSNHEEGTGLGLQIIKRIAETHGWMVSPTESADGGARFEITGIEFLTSSPS